VAAAVEQRVEVRVQALQRGPLGAGHARHLAQRVHRRARHARVRVAAQLA